MKIKHAAALAGTLALSSAWVLTHGLNPAQAGGPPPARVQVWNDGSSGPELNIGDAPKNQVWFYIYTQQQFSAPCEVVVETVDGTATGGADYSAFSTTLQFPAGENFGGWVPVTIEPDNMFEPDGVADDGANPPTPANIETLSMQISPGAGINYPPCPIDPAASSATGTITDDDAPGPLRVNLMPDVRVCESIGTAFVQLRVNRNLASNESLGYKVSTQDGTAGDPGDYTGFSYTESFVGNQGWFIQNNGTPADTTDDYYLISYGVPIVDDWAPELDEFFKALLENVNYVGPNGHIISDNQQMVTIRNDDLIGNFLTVHNTSEWEGDPGDDNRLTFTIESDQPAICDGIKIHYYTQDGTVYGEAAVENGGNDPFFGDADYNYQSGYVWIDPGATEVDVDIEIVEDENIENDERMYLVVDEPLGVVDGDGNQPVGEGTILDDDFPWVDVRGDYVVEGTGAGSTQLEFKFRLSGTAASPNYVPHRPIWLCYETNNITAVAPGDFTDKDDCVEIGPWDDRAYVYVDVVRDSVPENNETMEMQIVSAANANIDWNDAEDFPDGRDDDADGVIYNDDNWVVNGIDVSVLEGNFPDPNHPAVVTFNLNAPAPTGGLTVDFSTQDGSASFLQPDYISNGYTISFPAGATSANVQVLIVPDDFPEQPSEYFWLNLFDPTNIAPGGCWGGCFILNIGHEPTVTIIDEDEEIPNTGFGSSADMTMIGLGLAGAGLLLVFATKRRRPSLG